MQRDALSILALRMSLPENMDPASDQVRGHAFSETSAATMATDSTAISFACGRY
jgi:hypothetical protein